MVGEANPGNNSVVCCLRPNKNSGGSFLFEPTEDAPHPRAYSLAPQMIEPATKSPHIESYHCFSGGNGVATTVNSENLRTVCSSLIAAVESSASI